VTLSSTSQTQVTSTFTLSVQDVNDAQPVSATYDVTAQSSITAQVITLCTAANAASSAIATNCAAGSTPATQATIDLLDVNGFGGRADLRVEFPAGAQLSLTNAAGQRGTINLTGSPQRLLAYRPPVRISTHDENGQPPATGAVFDEIAYNIIRRVGGTDVETSTASLRFQVRARQSFAGDVLGSFSSLGCNGCHNGTQDGAPNFTQSADNVYAIFRNANGTFNTLLNNNAISYVTLPPTAATSSGLYCWPLINGCGTGTTHPPVSFTDAQLSVIRQWAEDGGNRF
jgi:cytochrome c5